MKMFVKSVSLLAAVVCAPAALGASCTAENFDEVSLPTLPSSWVSTVDKGAATTNAFKTRNGYSDSANNSVWADDVNDYADVSLYSPTIHVASTGSSPTVTFRQSYYLWAPEAPSGVKYTTAYDGAVLEVSINGAAFTDIVAAGGSFTKGGYNKTLDANFANPIAPSTELARPVWSGDSGGFGSVIVHMPASAVGGTVRLRWRLGTAGGGRSYDTHSGWWIDSLDYSALRGDLIFADGFDGGCSN